MLKTIDVPPVTAVNVRGGVEPQPFVDGAVELLMVTPLGRLSVTEKLVRFVSDGAVIKIRNREFPPAEIDEGEKDFDASKSVPRIVTFAVDCRKFPTP